MAEGALKKLLDKERSGKFNVISAGTHAGIGFPATKYAQEAVKIWEIDISQHMSQPLSLEMIEKADLIIALSSEHHYEITRLNQLAEDKTYLLKNFPELGGSGESVSDPIGMPLDAYNEVFLEIGECLGVHLSDIIKKIDSRSYVQE